MKIDNFEKLYEKYPIDREDMSVKEEREFVSHCFDIYEKEGFSKVFWSMGGDFPEYQNKPFKVIERAKEPEHDLCVLPMWKIQFEDGKVISAYPDEVIPSEMQGNGCPFTNI